MCSREPSIRVKLSPVYLTQISFFPDIHRNLERTGNLRFSSHSSCWIQDFSIPVQLLLSLIQMLSSPCAFSEVWAVEPLEMDHWTDDGFDSPFLKNKRKKPNTTQLLRKLLSNAKSSHPRLILLAELWTWSTSPGRKGMHQHHQDFILSFVDPSAHPPSNSSCWQWQNFFGHPYQCRCH